MNRLFSWGVLYNHLGLLYKYSRARHTENTGLVLATCQYCALYLDILAIPVPYVPVNIFVRPCLNRTCYSSFCSSVIGFVENERICSLIFLMIWGLLLCFCCFTAWRWIYRAVVVHTLFVAFFSWDPSVFIRNPIF